MRLRALLTILLFLSLVKGRAVVPGVVEECPFQLREGLIWIQVRAPASQETLNFIVDSGAQSSVINLPTARRLGLKLGGPVGVRGVKSNVNGYWVRHWLARVGTVALPRDFVAVDLQNLSHACGCGVDGLLGADFFKEHCVQIDFKKQIIRLPQFLPPCVRGETIPLQVRPSGLIVTMQVNDRKKEKMRLDTGCASPLQWVAPKSERQPYSRQIAVGMTEVSIPLITTCARLGDTAFTGVPTGLQDHQIFAGEAGLLGTPFLSRFALVTVDALSRRLILEKN